jgi:MerR family mercuric resistance operon transcriptional regulator
MKAVASMSIGALSHESGVNIETIRYYEKAAVMPKPARSRSGYRLYGPEHVKRLTFVRRGRELGFSLDALRGLLRLVDEHNYTCAEVHAIASAHLAEIEQKIADLTRLRRVMAGMVAQCARHRVPDCPVIDALFQAGPLPGALEPARRHRRSIKA